MDIVLLDYYLRLFAILANIFPRLVIDNIKEFLKSTVFNELNQEIRLESFKLFNEYYSQYSCSTKETNIQFLLQTLQQIDAEIPQRQKFQILLRVLIFKKAVFIEDNDPEFNKLVESISQTLNIDNTDYNNCKAFIAEKIYNIEKISNLLIISENGNYPPEMPTLKRKNLQGQIFFLLIENPFTILFIYKGNQTITYNKQIIKSSTVYFLNRGSFIKSENIETIYYNQVYQKFKIKEKVQLRLDVCELEFKYKNSNHGIHKLNLTLESEQLIGIIGRSGVGKSTLINLLIGNKKPDEGSIAVNGIELDQNNEDLDGLIGYVSQDDLLIEDLTVSTNLLLNARLCLGDLPDEILEEKVNQLLSDLDLFDVKDLQVGSPLHRLISGGQRKKLNIALELIREPWILFADEPTSGLSSSDSEEIMHLLSEQTSKGKIVVVNIHQPSSDVFKLFDKIIVLDREGYPVYFGNPIDAIPYFNDYFQKLYINADICEVCENVNPEAIFKVLEEKRINEFGEFIKRRKTTPFEWHQHFVNHNPPPQPKAIIALPKVQFSKPGALKQFLIFSKRNILSKLANTQYILLAMIISPALAAVLSSLCRYNNINESATEYFYAYNENIPSYFFMSVIVALFLGLIMSAEEIIRDRKIVMRESFLRLSKLSYINSKIAFVFGVSAVQSLLYVLIGNSILGIESMNLSFWFIMFSTSCFANILGLLISSMLNSVIAVYIMVPLIIVPQMLLSGVVVNYDKINKYLSSSEFVPFVGDIMASRWAYEAMVVTEFSSNDYQKYYFEVEQEESNVKFNLLFVIPELKKAVIGIEKKQGKNIDNHLNFIKNESKKLQNLPFVIISEPKNPSELKTLKKQFDKISDYLSDRLNVTATKKDSITQALIGKFGSTDSYLACKSNNYNNSLADLVLKRKELEPYAIVNNKIVRQMEPVYQVPGSNYGRAQFLSAVKKIGDFTIKTFNFNILVIWTMTIMVYVVLVFVSGNRHSKKMLKLMNGKHSNRFK